MPTLMSNRQLITHKNEPIFRMNRKECHWCGEKLQGLVSEFVHCIRCNERRVIEGLSKTFDPCPVCMTLKSGGKAND